jgi:hypothetical protein
MLKYDCSILGVCLFFVTMFHVLTFDHQPRHIFNTNYDAVVGGGRTHATTNFTYTGVIISNECNQAEYKIIATITKNDVSNSAYGLPISCVINQDNCYSISSINKLVGTTAQISFDTSCPEICDTVTYTSKKAVRAYDDIQMQWQFIAITYILALFVPFASTCDKRSESKRGYEVVGMVEIV